MNDRQRPEDSHTRFREIFDRYAKHVWRALLALGVPAKDVEDASQQVFLVVYRRLKDVDPAGPVRAFVYGVCLRVARDFRRRAQTRREHLVAEMPEQSVSPGQEAGVSDRESFAWLLRALNRLDESKREVFVLYEVEELEMPEITASLGCPLQTGYARLHAARDALRAAYAREMQTVLENA